MARLWSLLTSQGMGVVCALTAASLLGIGSFTMDLRPELYGELRLDDLRFFFAPWRLAHLWLYLLCCVLGLWGLSALLCTLQTVTSLVRGRVTLGPSWGPPLLHLAFLLALVAHLWGGLSATSDVVMVSTNRSTPLGEASYRLLRLQQELYPSGMPRRVQAVLERSVGADQSEVTIGYNQPLVTAAGAQQWLFARVESVPTGQLDRTSGQPKYELLLLLHHRHNPSVPLVIGTALLVALGVLLVSWGRLQRATRIRP
jgi:hypothetical protein